MVASSSNLLIPQQPVSSTVATRTTTTTTDNFTNENINHGFLIASNSMNSISGGNLKDIIRLDTVADARQSTAKEKYLSPRRKSTGGAVAAVTTTAKSRRARPRRQKMASFGVDAMRMMSNSTCTPIPSTTTTMIASALTLCRGEVEQAAAAVSSALKSQPPPPQQEDGTLPLPPINNLNLAFSSLLLSVSNNNDNVDEDDEWGTFVSLDDEEDVYFHRYGR